MDLKEDKRGPGRPKKTEAQKTRISVLERRLQNPFGEPSSPIDLTKPGMIPRWFNGAIINDKVWRAKQKGWIPVRPSDVADQDQIGGTNVSPDGFVVRGDRGQEVLMMMLRDEFDQIQMAKTRHNIRVLRDPNRQQSEILESAASKFGSETADLMAKKTRVYNDVTDSREILERVDVE